MQYDRLYFIVLRDAILYHAIAQYSVAPYSIVKQGKPYISLSYSM